MRLPRLRSRALAFLVIKDAAALLARHGEGAYERARTRAREERLGKVRDDGRPGGHWDRVRREIARQTGKAVGEDTATRYTER